MIPLPDHRKTIEDLVRETLDKMGFTPDIVVTQEEGADVYLCRIQLLQDQNFLIGQHGVNLAAIQHLIRVLARRKTGERLNIIVDVNDYFAEKKEGLEREAREAGEKSMATNAAITLRPMQAYERKVIHAFLAEQEGVSTESIGMGEDRRIVVRPKIAE